MTHRCPACGVPLADGLAHCPRCKTSVAWTNGRPSVAFDPALIRPERPVGLVVATLAALALAAIWLLQ